MKVLVCGGRDFDNPKAVSAVLDKLHARQPITRLIEGGARGADRAAHEWAKAHGLAHVTYPADWNTHGKAAGPIRNAQMLADGNPDVVVAFPGGTGTTHMVSIAEKAGVRVIRAIPTKEPA